MLGRPGLAFVNCLFHAFVLVPLHGDSMFQAYDTALWDLS